MAKSPPNMASRAAVVLPCSDLNEDITFFCERLGFRLDAIGPADAPRSANLSGHGLALRLDVDARASAPLLRIESTELDAGDMEAPGGTSVRVIRPSPPGTVPPVRDELVITRYGKDGDFGVGRAGMLYRDLIPSRLGGAVIASHIRIPEGGPVPDLVHFHSVHFQLIFCIAGWVDLVYEDQGPPFRLRAGDCVIQPPEIRHRVLVASAGLEVIEIGVPAQHPTSMDHAMDLPTSTHRPERTFSGTRFVLHRASEVVWQPWRIKGFEAQVTDIAQATGGIADVQVARYTGNGATSPSTHDAKFRFDYLRAGALTLAVEGEEPTVLRAGDSFVVPPGIPNALTHVSSDCELIEVALYK